MSKRVLELASVSSAFMNEIHRTIDAIGPRLNKALDDRDVETIFNCVRLQKALETQYRQAQKAERLMMITHRMLTTEK